MFLTPYTKKNELHNYNPFRAMEEMERAFFGGNGIAEFKTDIRDTGDAYVLEADLPGFKKDDINRGKGRGRLPATGALLRFLQPELQHRGRRCERHAGEIQRRCFDAVHAEADEEGAGGPPVGD